jgi:hypothetical protein
VTVGSSKGYGRRRRRSKPKALSTDAGFGLMAARLEHRAGKWMPVFRKSDAKTKI